MRVGIASGDLSAERLRYLKQIGADDVFVRQTTESGRDRLTIAPGEIPSVERLLQVRKRHEDQDLRMTGVQSLPGALYDAIMFGEADAPERTADIKQLLRNMGKANIPILGYQWNPRARNIVFSTSTSKRLRGGATTREFDLDEINDPEASSDPDAPEYDEAAFWERYEAFLEEVLPVAEEAGVRMALHPADPPVVETLEGIPRLFRDVGSFERAMEAVPSPAHGLKLCLGCFSEMGEDVADVVRRFGERDQIVFVHFRDVVGTMPHFYESFVDEGNFDEYDVMKTLLDVGFSGVLIPDHVPSVEGDPSGSPRARGWTVGYLKGLRTALHEEYGA